jgi:hypothetical protein
MVRRQDQPTETRWCSTESRRTIQMNAQQKSRTTVAGFVLAAVLGASVGVVAAGVLPSQPGATERGMHAWSQRLTDRAEALRQERSDSAYGARLRLASQQRVDDAYSDRLNGLADAHADGGMSDRAARAWTDRLNGLADR